jgi:general secretion pathway protein D
MFSNLSLRRSPLRLWLALGSLALGAGLSTYGQAPAGSAPAFTAPPPGAQPANATAGEEMVKVNFPNSPIQAILPFYQQLTGKRMILDGALQGETMRITSPTPLTKSKAIAFIEASLLLNGYAVIQQDDNETIKLIHHTGGKSPTAEWIPVYASIVDLPKVEQICHFVLPLQHISPDEAQKAFTTVIQLHSYGKVHPVNNTSNVIITENSATIRAIHDLAQIIDVPPAEIANEMIQLNRADVEQIAEIINEIYEEKEKSDSVARNNPQQPAAAPGAPNVPGAAAAPVNSTNSANSNPTAAKVKVIPYKRTNSLLVIARPVDITYIRSLITKLDSEGGNANFLQRKLRYMSVMSFLDAAKKALSRDTDIESDGGSSNGVDAPRSSRRRSGSTSTPSTDASRQANNNNGFGGNGGFNNGGFGGGFNGSNSSSTRSSLPDPDEVGAPESIVVGRTLLIADPGSNSLIVDGSPEHVQIIDKLIKTLDVRPQQVYISTIIGQLTLGKQYDYGFNMLRALDDFTLRNNGSNAPTTPTTPGTGSPGTGNPGTGNPGTGNPSTGGPTTGGPTTGGPTTGGNNGALAAGAPGLIDLPFNADNLSFTQFNLYGQIASFGRYVNLLEGNSDFKVLSRPSIYTTNNGKAVISSGQRIAVPVSTLSNVGSGFQGQASVSSAIDYRDVVLKLEVVPLINSEDELTLTIAQVNDNIIGSQNLGGNNVPTIGTQEMVTTVTVKDGSTVVLGGLITERQQEEQNGVIFLRRIPIIKHLFNRTQKNVSREELLVFIQPRIIKSEDPLDMPNHIEAGRSTVIDEALDFGTRLQDVPKAIRVKGKK